MKRALADSAVCEDSDINSDNSGSEEIHVTSSDRAKSGAAKYLTKFKPEWTKQWPFIASGSTTHHFWCNICRVERSCGHQGRRDIERHIGSEGHIKKAKDVKSSKKIKTFFTAAPTVDTMTPLEAKVSSTFDISVLTIILWQTRRAEVKVCTTLVKHNIPLAFADHLTPLFHEIFPDSDIAKAYSSGKTKTTCIINGALQPYYKDQLVQQMKDGPFSISIDGSNDSGKEKMNPMTVKVFDVNKIKHKFFDMCTTSGTDAGTAEVIFNKMESVLHQSGISWKNCVSLSVDNASVNMGRRNSLSSRVLKEHDKVYIIGCPCHILHNTAAKAGTSFTGATGFDIEELVIDVSYWFDASTKRKGGLEEFCIFCDIAYKEVVAHVSTRWLSLEKAVNRILQLYEALVSYFKSNSESQARFKRLNVCFSKPITEVYLLFFQSVIPSFTKLNQLLQRESPSIYMIFSQIRAFLKNLLIKFIQPQVIVDATGDLTKVAYDESSLQLDDHQIHIGMFTRSKMRKLLDEGDISPSEVQKFTEGVKAFFTSAISYSLTHLPFDDELLQSAQFVDIMRRTQALFIHVLYFVERFSDLLPFTDVRNQEILHTEFAEFQTLQDSDIPASIWCEAKIQEKDDIDGDDIIEYYRMDVLWAYLATVKDSVTGQLTFSRLAKVAKLVLTIPHSNADEERVFSLVRQNKTDFRNSLALDGTLASILTVKMSCEEPCYKFEPTSGIIKRSKKVTWEYNKKHKN